MKILRYTPAAKAISDWEISSFVDYMIQSSEQQFCVSTHLVIDEIRARVAENKISKDLFHILVTDVDGKEKRKKLLSDGKAEKWYETEEVGSRIISRILSTYKN